MPQAASIQNTSLIGIDYTQRKLSSAIYDLTQKNVRVTDPVDSRFSIQHGQVGSRGVELEARARLWKDTGVIAAYAYTDAGALENRYSGQPLPSPGIRTCIERLE